MRRVITEGNAMPNLLVNRTCLRQAGYQQR